jgi:hypothetical protein
VPALGAPAQVEPPAAAVQAFGAAVAAGLGGRVDARDLSHGSAFLSLLLIMQQVLV